MKRTKMSKVLSAALSATMICAFGGCSVVTSDPVETQSVSSETTSIENTTVAETVVEAENTEPALSGELEIQIFTNETDAANNAWNSIIDAFEAQTGVKVVRNMGSQINTEMDTRWMQGNAPDVVLLNGGGINADVLQSSGLLMDISDIMNHGYVYGTDQLIKDSIGDNLVTVSDDGAIYRAPILRSTKGIWYDADYLKQLGIDEPTHYSEFVEAGKEAVEAGTSALTYPGQYPSYCLGGLIYPAMAAYGQEYFDQLGKADPEAFKSQNMTDILQRYSDYCANDGFIMPSTSTLDHTSSQIKWLNHEATFITVGLWLPDEVRSSTSDDFKMTFGLSPLIADNQPTTAVFSTIPVAVSKDAKNVENAEAFVRFLYTDAAQSALMAGLSQISVLNTLDYAEATKNADPAVATAMEAAAAAENQVYDHISWGDVGTVFGNVINDLTLGNITVEEAQAQLIEAAEKEQTNK